MARWHLTRTRPRTAVDATARRLLLLAMCGPALASADSYVEFFRAVEVDNAPVVSELLRRGFDPNAVDEKGQLALFLALRAGSDRVASALLAHPDLRVDRTNALGETALMMAALRGREDWVTRLLAAGAQVNRPGWTPLHYAASAPTIGVLKMLLDKGATIDARAPNGATPLMTAAQHGPEEAVAALLAAGADRSLRDARERSAADLARAVGREALALSLEAPKR